MPSRDGGEAPEAFRGAGSGEDGGSCSGDEGSAQHLKRAARCENTESTKSLVAREIVMLGKEGGRDGFYLGARGEGGWRVISGGSRREAGCGREEGDGECCRDGRHGRR
jgi:hypothetical protein